MIVIIIFFLGRTAQLQARTVEWPNVPKRLWLASLPIPPADSKSITIAITQAKSSGPTACLCILYSIFCHLKSTNWTSHSDPNGWVICGNDEIWWNHHSSWMTHQYPSTSLLSFANMGGVIPTIRRRQNVPGAHNHSKTFFHQHLRCKCQSEHFSKVTRI